MRILKVIHGFPPRYSAGSEVYSKELASSLAENHEVQVLCRYENSFLPDYHYKTELCEDDPRILLHLINVPRTKYPDKFVHTPVEELFLSIISQFNPHIVHFGHLNYLSIRLPSLIKDKSIAKIFTLHDFWLMCPRGQFIQRNSESPWQMCTSQEDSKCASQCYSGKFSGDEANLASDKEYWNNFIKLRMEYAREVIKDIDLFISPSRYLLNEFSNEFPEITDKITYLDYGFDLGKFEDRNRTKQEGFTFGYIGTHTPQKGIQDLLEAFAKLDNDKAKLKIWGAKRDDSTALEEIANTLPAHKKEKICWMGGYKNSEIINVFNQIDALVVPSIWGENSPLVIHEAQQAKVPVITAEYGGMKEYVKHNTNGLLFNFRDTNDLSVKMEKYCNEPEIANKHGNYGYLYNNSGNIPSIEKHTEQINNLYKNILDKKNISYPKKDGPWRITFDTNPDHCNYSCIMCECFSPYSDVAKKRKEEKRGKRVMSIEVIRQIIEDSKDTPLKEIIPSTMGEPLLYKDFTEIINLCHEYNLKLNLTTNGSFPIKGVEKWAELLLPVLSDVKFSWNAASKELQEHIMRGSNWEQMYNNLAKFLQLRDEYTQNSKGHYPSVTLQLTFLENNLRELPKLLNMAIELGVNRVKGHHLWAHFDQIKNLSMRRNNDSIKRWNEVVEELYNIRDNTPLASGEKIKLENIEYLTEEATEDLAPGGPCPFLGKEAWVNAEGEFNSCCAPDNLRKSLGYFGNLNEKSINEIWKSPEYNHLRKNYLQKDLCKTCNMRKSLKG